MIWDYFGFDLAEDWPHLIVDDQVDQNRREDCPPRALRYLPDRGGRHSPSPVCRHTTPHRPPQAKACSGMTASSSVNEEASAISASKIWQTRPFQPSTAVNRHSAEQIDPSAAVRNNLLEGEADLDQTF